jgi:hypothetical protein
MPQEVNMKLITEAGGLPGFREATMTKGIWIVILMFLGTGCATRTQQWQTQLWQTQNNSTEQPEIGRLETENLTFDILCTGVHKIESFVGISVSCRNHSDNTVVLEFNPIQVVDASQMLAKPLSQSHVMFKLHGGKWQEKVHQERLVELSQPVATGSTFDPILEAFRGAVDEALRGTEKSIISNELNRKQALRYDLYYQNFTRTSLPPGIATTWTEYYPYPADTITVMLQGQQVEDGVSFVPPMLPQPKYLISPRVAKILVGSIVAIPLTLIIIANII